MYCLWWNSRRPIRQYLPVFRRTIPLVGCSCKPPRREPEPDSLFCRINREGAAVPLTTVVFVRTRTRLQKAYSFLGPKEYQNVKKYQGILFTCREKRWESPWILGKLSYIITTKLWFQGRWAHILYRVSLAMSYLKVHDEKNIKSYSPSISLGSMSSLLWSLGPDQAYLACKHSVRQCCGSVSL